uniref:Orf125 protein n=1 Tax=Beta vulgaris subsp. vulgaris TaxID=3555 RepID=Q5U6G2_BETVV|nr:orf125 [Beta vulgaris subsp. vulgaris]
MMEFSAKPSSRSAYSSLSSSLNCISTSPSSNLGSNPSRDPTAKEAFQLLAAYESSINGGSRSVSASSRNSADPMRRKGNSSDNDGESRFISLESGTAEIRAVGSEGPGRPGMFGPGAAPPSPGIP